MFSRVFFLFLFLFISCSFSFACVDTTKQSRFEIYLDSDNDVFLRINFTDQDYTFGEMLGLRLKAKNNNLFLLSKKASSYIHQFELGFKAFTPKYKAKDFDPLKFNLRPFAGWIYAEYSQLYSFKRSILTSGLQLGSIGPNANMGELQNWYHTSLNLGKFIEGWENQIPNFIGVNLYSNYKQEIQSKNNLLFYFVSEASIGNIFSHLDNRIGFILGKSPSIFTTSNLNRGNNKNSLFFEANFGGKLTLYDATLQGNPLKEKRYVESNNINRLSFIGSCGIRYFYSRWLFSVFGNYQSRVVKNFEEHRYGYLSVNYSF